MDPCCSLVPGTELHVQGHPWEEEKAIPGLGKAGGCFLSQNLLHPRSQFLLTHFGSPRGFWISLGGFFQLSQPGISQCTRCSCGGHPLRNTHTPSSPRAWERQRDGKRGKPEPETGREELGGLWAAALSCWKTPTPTSAFQKHPLQMPKYKCPKWDSF